LVLSVSFMVCTFAVRTEELISRARASRPEEEPRAQVEPDQPEAEAS